MSNCGCNNSTPAATAPPNCSPIPAYVDPPTTETEPCCLACVYDELTVEWTKPEEETEIPLPVCDSSRYMQGQCVFVLGTNGLGGTYSITAILDDAITVEPHDGANFDVGGPGNVVGGRVFLLPSCPLTQQALIDIVSPEFPDDFVLEVHASSDTTHGFSLSVVDGKIKLVYNQTNFEAQVATALGNLGVTYFQPELTDTPLILEATGTLNTSPYQSTGTIDYATDFGTSVPAGATHALMRVKFRLSAYESTAGEDAESTGTIEFEGNAATAVHNTAQHTGASNAVGVNQGHVNTVDVLRLVPIDAGESDWVLDVTAYPTPAGVNDSADALVHVYLVGWLIAL